MTDKKVWIDPSDCGLSTVEAAEQKRKQEVERQQREEMARKRRQEAEQRRKEYEERQRRWKAMEAVKQMHDEKNATKTQALVNQPKREILPPAPKAPALPLPDANSLGLPDLSKLEGQIRQATKMLDLSVPEGWLDRWFGRPNHRIDVKTDRGQRLAGYIDACTAILEAARAHQASRYQIYLDQVAFLRRVAKEQCQLELTRRRAERQDAIESAHAMETVAMHEGNTREHNLRGRPSIPPPVLPPPAPVDEATRKREAARREKQELLDLDLQELDLKAEAGQEKVTRAKTKATEIFRNVSLSSGEVRARIQEVLDAYNLDWTILPLRIAEFMETESEKESSDR